MPDLTPLYRFVDPKILKIPKLKLICNHTVLHYLPLVMQRQTQTNWCWSAVGTSVGLFFQTGQWTQCDTANGCLKLAGVNCCNAPTPAACNVYGYLDKALTYTKSFKSVSSGTATTQALADQINMGRPVGVRVEWNGGGAHFMAITGYKYCAILSSVVTIVIQDPIFGETIMLYRDFAANYQSGGTWNGTYLTKPN
ncbi:MAG: hypothetical protein HQL51_02640 [Magnetococcales bacterium]|nr:hypothetical protein [Magnetococcales bacterium]